MVAQIKTQWEIQVAAGKPPAVIRAKNLHTTIKGPSDAWGRHGKPQPMVVSAEVSLNQPFASSSSTDAVSGDTVHYGLLSKAILATLGRLSGEEASSGTMTLSDVLNKIWLDLTGFDIFGELANGDGDAAFLTMTAIRHLCVTISLPKASLLGNAISLTCTGLFGSDGGQMSVHMRGLALKIHELRLPTLIGVNDNERKAKQVVVANVEVDRFDRSEDHYTQLEALVTQTISDSSFETLEALAAHVASEITKHFIDLQTPSSEWQLTIGLEKPIAVPLADAACVELSTSTNDMAKR